MGAMNDYERHHRRLADHDAALVAVLLCDEKSMDGGRP